MNGAEIINFKGPEGSGKSTIARLLAARINKPLVSTGDILRFVAETDMTELGDECRDMFKNDRYMKAEILLKILVAGLGGRDDLSGGFVMDGGLRTVEETKGYREMLRSAKRDFPLKVVKLDVPDSVGIARLVGNTRPGRKPDTIESVQERLRNYHYRLFERLALIRQMDRCELIEIDATGSIDVTFGLVCQALMVENL
jgi:adenylate kinase family enzyme